MNQKMAMEILTDLLNSLEARGADKFTPAEVAALANRRAQALRVIMGMPAVGKGFAK